VTTARLLLLIEAHRKILLVLKATQEFDKSKESHPGGWMLWVEDSIKEEIIILKEIEMELKAVVQQMFEEARSRAVKRETDYFNLSLEAAKGFGEGLAVAYDITVLTPAMMQRIQTETTYGFAFIAGMLCKVEAIKGRHYAAIWQKRGEQGILDNLMRKANRAEQVVELANLAPDRPMSADDGETLSETLGDGTVYSIKWLTWRKELKAQEFLDFLKKVQALGKEKPENAVGGD
jgi:hypothetical protein